MEVDKRRVHGRSWPSVKGQDKDRATQAFIRLENITRLISEWVWEADETGRITFASDRVLEVLGYLPFELVGQTFTDFGEFYKNGNVAIPDWKNPFRKMDFITKNKTGDEKIFLLSSIPFYHPETWEFEGVTGTAEDITQMRKNECELRKSHEKLEVRVLKRTAELKESEARLEAILNLAPEAVITADENLRITMFNQGAVHVFGHAAEDVIGQSIEILMPEELRVGHGKHVEGFENSFDIYSQMDNRLQISGLKKGGTMFPAVASISKHASNGDVVYTAVIQDVSERVAREEKVQQLMNEVILASKAKTDFLASMSHELRTPLNAIIGFSDTMSGQYLGPLGSDRYIEYAGNISSSGKHLLSMVNDILDIERIEAGKYEVDFESFDIQDVLNECNATIGYLAENKKIAYNVDCPNGIAHLYADRRAVFQVLLNLVTNAIKFTQPGGDVTISINVSETHHIFQICDTGVGIPNDKISALTDPFVRHKPDAYVSQDGVGLGLAICKSLVELHNGELIIESILDKGTVVTVKLPSKPKSSELPAN